MKKQLLLDLQDILRNVPGVEKVSHGKVQPLATETHFTSIYIAPETATYESRAMGTKLSGYDDFFFVTLIVNTDNSGNELAWTDIETDIINAVLDDSSIWTILVDRDVVTSGYDGYENFPKREIQIVFEFRLRAKC